MRLCTVIASAEGFRHSASNDARTACGTKLIKWAANQRASLIAFPAGYVRADDESSKAIETCAAPILVAARSVGIAVVVGVDACRPDWVGKRSLDEIVAGGRMPLFAVAWAPGQRGATWRQRSTTSTNWRFVAPEERHDVRSVRVGRRNVGVVLCGEAFNRDARNAAAEAKLGVAVLIAHGAAGLRHWQAIRWFNEHGLTCVRAVHAAHGADNLLWTTGAATPPKGSERAISGKFWAEASVFGL